jgi:hypothetical protein
LAAHFRQVESQAGLGGAQVWALGLGLGLHADLSVLIRVLQAEGADPHAPLAEL